MAAFAHGQTPVFTYHNDNGRTGQYSGEILLGPSTVSASAFGKRFTYMVDGAVYAQPLYMPRVSIGGTLHDVLFVATAHDSVYAFDADNPGSGQPLWRVSFLDSANGVTSVPEPDVSCPVISPELGIVGTPAIDAQSGTLYAIAFTKEPGPSYVYRLHALDITSGAERPSSPVAIAPAGFVPLAHKQRGALLVSGGLVYSAWGSHCDQGTYHGWLVANDEVTLNQTAVYNTTPNGNGASLWNAGAGPAADQSGNVFVVTANGDFDANTGGTEYGDSVLKLSPMSLALSDFFTPFNQSLLDDADLDLGSSGTLLLPDSAGSSAHPHLLVTAGKEGRLYLLDRDNLGGAQAYSDVSALASLPVLGQSAFGMAAWFNGSVYIASQQSPLRAFVVSEAAVSSAAQLESADMLGNLGASPSISSNGTASGVVWLYGYSGGPTLRAYDAATLAELYNSQNQPWDLPDSYAEFAVPTVANGKVYVGTLDSVTMYGARIGVAPVIGGVANAASYEAQALAPGSLVAIFGTELSMITASAPSVPLPVSLADVSIQVNGFPAPLLYISPGQINAQLPAELSEGTAQMVVSVAGVPSAAFNIDIQASAPGIFTASGTAAAINLDGGVNGPTEPVPVGSAISVFLTGTAPLEANVVDGAAALPGSTANAAANVSATLGGEPAPVLYAGPAPNFVGLIQVNLTVPALPTGSFPLVITVNGKATNPALVYVQAQ
jgi:uncharacterized protein (TIGR03437 family)